ncbi:DMT family transporter [Kocuria sp.]|uniref:DMT family transporter n=1 Tax=Kocuria sp. TaxID=1871328 RepID=UPI0026E00887|nr:EamA family transporter [Kocuria sp.]MDO5618164.1 EamA family transporter [Kocuria sp.]
MSRTAPGTTPGILAVGATSILWGTTGTAATFAPEVSPVAIGAVAMGIGGLLQAAIAWRSIRRDRPLLRTHAWLMLLGACAVVVYPLAFYSSMHLAGVAIGTVVSLASAPLASGLLERILDGRKLGIWWMVAATLGILGGALLCLAKTAQPEASALETLAGIGLGLVAGTSYAMYSWVVHRLLEAGVSRGAAMGCVFGTGGLLLLPVLLATGAPLLASPGNFAVGAYMALVPMFLGYVLFGIGLTRIRPSTATTITLSEPAVAALLAVLVVGEQLSSTGWAGLSVLGIALVILALAPDTPPAPPLARTPNSQESEVLDTTANSSTTTEVESFSTKSGPNSARSCSEPQKV